MSQEKIRNVLDFPKPVLSKQLKSFLGLVNYFHDFVRNASTVVYPMNQMLLNYNKYKKITWTIEALRESNLIKYEISKCTTMHFLSEIGRAHV